jgi:hypothetical protein
MVGTCVNIFIPEPPIPECWGSRTSRTRVEARDGVITTRNCERCADWQGEAGSGTCEMRPMGRSTGLFSTTRCKSGHRKGKRAKQTASDRKNKQTAMAFALGHSSEAVQLTPRRGPSPVIDAAAAAAGYQLSGCFGFQVVGRTGLSGPLGVGKTGEGKGNR